jgi:hypothetical protein
MGRRAIAVIYYAAVLLGLACITPSDGLSRRIAPLIPILTAPVFVWLYVRFANGRPAVGVVFVATVTCLLPIASMFVFFEFDRPNMTAALSDFLSSFLQVPVGLNLLWIVPTIAASMTLPFLRRSRIADAP